MGKRERDNDDDAALWERVAETAAPLKRGRGVGSPKSGKAAMSAPNAKPPKVRPAPRTIPKPSHVPRAEPLDRRTARQLEKGRLEVEARLDLHGMRQCDAHAQLRRFLKMVQACGLCHALIITGKGADPEARTSFYEEDERGVLRNAVPRWLAEPDFAPLVVSFSPAPRRLGGDGALYVRIRKKKPSIQSVD
ncbi:MAG TPA: Smr/MutS family protein [Methyloceanibacter sp.]|nr:Smr/MutS family protein [Methyloceanibacter sp.]